MAKEIEPVQSVPEVVTVVLQFQRLDASSPFELVHSHQEGSVALSELQVIFLLTRFLQGSMSRVFPGVEQKLEGIEKRRVIVAAAGDLGRLH